jgi:enoyl-CoA hydratase/carnithine racemase
LTTPVRSTKMIVEENVSEPTVIIRKKEHIAAVTLNRPGTGNAVDERLARELGDICRDINGDDDIHVVTVTGAGKFFCGDSGTEGVFPTASYLAAIEKPVVAIINGDALGQGLELALACDIRLAAEGARFGFPQVAQGRLPADGGTQRLPRVVGRGKALELLLTAESIDAFEALRIGLVSRVVGADKLAAEAETLAKTVAMSAPISLRYIKEAVGQGLDLTAEQGLRLEADLYFLIHTTADRTEGIKAFLQKRPPEFRGK